MLNVTSEQYKQIHATLAQHPDQSRDFQSTAFRELVLEYHRLNEQDYKVGYKKPPRQTRFKPGWRGGPGRPKLSKVCRAFMDYLGADKQRLLDQLVESLVAKALKGDLKAMKLVIEFVDGKPIRRISQ